MGILGIGRGVLLTFGVSLALAVLKKLIIVFGLLFALIKFGIVIVFIALLISILVAMFRDRSGAKNPSPNL